MANNEVILVDIAAEEPGDIALFNADRWNRHPEGKYPELWVPFSKQVGSSGTLYPPNWRLFGAASGGAWSLGQANDPWSRLLVDFIPVTTDDGWYLTTCAAPGYGTGVTDIKSVKADKDPILTLYFVNGSDGQNGAQDIYAFVGAVETLLSSTPDGWYFKLDTASSANWKAVTRSGGSETSTDTGVANGGTVRRFTIYATSSKVRFYIDGVLKATHTTNIDTALMYPVIQELYPIDDWTTYTAVIIGCHLRMRP